jgi:branched-chain amino acid transport system ATP-binding protein
MLLSVENLRVFYGPIEAIHGVSFHVDEGEIVSIIGNNGAGKSTLLNTISGIVRAMGGEIHFRGKSILSHSAASIVKMGIAHTPEGRQVFPNSTVYDNLMAGAYTRSDTAEIKKDIDMYCQRFPILGQRLKQKAGFMSGGEQQMLSIARSLMSRPKLLMLDEPSLGLAPVVVELVYNIIEEIRKDGTSILLVEQNASRALSVADRAYVLVTGEIVLDGGGAALAADDRVRQAYLGV